MVKEGWTDRDTGKKGDPRLQFVDFKMLQDVFDNFAKKLNIMFDIKDLNANLIANLNAIFNANKGDNQVVFDVLEVENIKTVVPVTIETIKYTEKIEPVLFNDSPSDEEAIFSEEILEDDEVALLESVNDVEENKIITLLSMPSRKLKIKISNELLDELEKMKVNFKLN